MFNSQSENARLALCEHPQWTPVVVILGLLQCSIPPVLKAELLKTLAAFGKSPEIAASLWQSLEYTQVVLQALLFITVWKVRLDTVAEARASSSQLPVYRDLPS